MVDWTSPQEITRDSVAYVNVVFASFGLYIWEIFQTSDFEWSIIQGKRKLKWQWIPFFITRYILVVSIASLMASFTVKQSINCQALFTFICVAGNLSIICASATLMLRTLAVWERKLPVVASLGVLALAHAALLFRGMFIMTTQYDAVHQTCVVSGLSHTNRVFLSVTFWATLGFNLVITVLYVVGLMRNDRGASVWELLFRDGVVYYLAAFTFNALPAILNILNLNTTMDLISTVPAAVLTAVAATRTVTRLPDPDDDDDIYVHSSTQIVSPRAPNPAALRFSQNKTRFPPRPEVHVTTDQIVMEDFEPSPSSLPDKAHSLMGDDKASFNAV